MPRSRGIRTSSTDDAGRHHRAGIVVSAPVHCRRVPCRQLANPAACADACGRVRRTRASTTSAARACSSTFRFPGAGSSARCRLPCHARLPCDVIASAKRVAIAGKSSRTFCANRLVRRQIGLPVVGARRTPEWPLDCLRKHAPPARATSRMHSRCALHATRNAFFYVLCENAGDVVDGVAKIAMRIARADRRGRRRTDRKRARKKIAPDC
jgi:hypothetical protein